MYISIKPFLITPLPSALNKKGSKCVCQKVVLYSHMLNYCAICLWKQLVISAVPL